VSDKPTKITPTRLKALALLAQDGALLHSSGFHHTRYWIRTPGKQLGDDITATTYQGLRDYIEGAEGKTFEDTWRISKEGKIALVDATFGHASVRFSIMLERARVLQNLSASLIQTRSRAGMTAITFEDESPESLMRQIEAQAQSFETKVVALLQEHFKYLRGALDDAMRAAGVEPDAPAPESEPAHVDA
jgi:hypothetical protein